MTAHPLERALPALRTSRTTVDRVAYARDLWPRHHLAVAAGHLPTTSPALVAWPESTAELAALVRTCAAEGLPLVPFGAGSGVCGGVLPDARTVVVDTKRLAIPTRIDRERDTIEVGAGVLGIRLEEDLEREGLTVGHFPSSILCSTVGGWLAARSAGQCSGRYGKIEDLVLGAELVDGTGAVVELSRRSGGPDLLPLVIGSEGVFGCLTKARLRLHPAPRERVFDAYRFPTLRAGTEAMRTFFQEGLRPAVTRLYDPFDTAMARLGKVKGASGPRHGPSPPGLGGLALRTALRAPGTLNGLAELAARAAAGCRFVCVFEGSEADEVRADAARAATIARHFEGEPLGDEPARAWFAHRYAVSYRQSPVLRAGAFADTMEVAAPWSRLDELHEAVRDALGPHVFVMAHFSHAYPDGCSIYFTFAGSAGSSEAAEARYDAAWRDALAAVVGAGGTIAHHHGVGRSKAPELGAELGAGIDLLAALRRAFDPAGVLNPTNLRPRDDAARAPAPPSPPPWPRVDGTSRLVRTAGSERLVTVEEAAVGVGCSLGLDPSAYADDPTVAAWLGAGAPGAPDPLDDPASHLVAGFVAERPGGERFGLAPAPRRSVGPDLFGLFFGTGDRFGRITAADLVIQGPYRPRPLPFGGDRAPPLHPSERDAWDRIAKATAG